MGVKDLWNIISPLCERKPLFELQGKVIAIDLSCWVVDSQTITDNVVQPKMYLRNLFFRTMFLLMQGISPVFVLEGTAPSLKHKTIAKRNDIRNGPRERKTAQSGNRSNFNRILKECKKMLQLMGLACVQGHGEAEAMCAYLNEDNLVDGCISQDSDCFLYGAKVVYRNFCTSAQGNRGGSNGAVDEYKMEKIEEILNLDRKKMIVLALLCGCDYDSGINGVGKEAVLKLFKLVKNDDILERIKKWRNDTSFEKLEAVLLNPNTCTSCGHNGKVQKHLKAGCVDCGTITKCDESYKEKRALMLNEITLRKKTLLVEDFPNQELIDEFLTRKSEVPSKLDLQWKQPRVTEFIHFVEKHLSWEPVYAFEKVFPLATRWQLLHLPDIAPDRRLTMHDLFIPEKIKKIRNIRSVASYEVIWDNKFELVEILKSHCLSDKGNDVMNDEEGNMTTLEELATIEPQHLVQNCYPDLIAAFESAKNSKSKKRTAKTSEKKTVEKNSEDNNDKQTTTKRKPRKKATQIPKNRKIDEFISSNRLPTLEESFEKMSITPKRTKKDDKLSSNVLHVNKENSETQPKNQKLKRGPQFNRVLQAENTSKLNNTLDRMFNELSPEDFATDNEEDLDMSVIIEKLCNKQSNFNFPTTEKESTLSKEDFRNTDNDNTNIVQLDTKEVNNSNEPVENESFDEFDNICESYVPIFERVKMNLQKQVRYSAILTANIDSEDGDNLGFDDLMNDTENSPCKV